jgi:hypothetical protein
MVRAIFLLESHKMVHFNLPKRVSGPLMKLKEAAWV